MKIYLNNCHHHTVQFFCPSHQNFPDLALLDEKSSPTLGVSSQTATPRSAAQNHGHRRELTICGEKDLSVLTITSP